MIRPTGRNWWIFGLCAAVLAAAMGWLTVVIVRLDAANAESLAARDHQIDLSKALWRMDSWFAPQLAREAARPYFEYQAYYPQRQVYTRMLDEFAPGEVLTASPLLTFRSEIFTLHFQFDAEGELTSPQVPPPHWRGQTYQNFGSRIDLDPVVARLDSLDGRDAWPRVRAACHASTAGRHPPWPVLSGTNDLSQRTRSQQQAITNVVAQSLAPAQDSRVEIGQLVPVWLDGGAGEDDAVWLLFVRRVQIGSRSLYQGVLADWSRLRTALLAETAEILPAEGVALSCLDPAEAGDGVRVLAAIPARFEAAVPVVVGGLGGSTVLVLGTVWGGLLIALLAVGFTLHSTNLLGQRRARFASAVTHELRTPLTTFRMYSEMLAEDMVSDPGQRREYLETLRGEADRLSRLVENVLSYARIEDGRFNARPVRLGLVELLGGIEPILEQRIRETGQSLEVTVEEDEEVAVDVEAVTQILFNLVDNACKYARGAEDRRIEVVAGSEAGSVSITVRDHGPGIPATAVGAIFQPFERAAPRPEEPEASGVGLGLALARALARDLGGSLDLVPSAEGAAFRLRLPRDPT